MLAAAPAGAETVIDTWTSITAPPAPVLKQATVDPATTALLVLDFVKANCNADRPRCLAALPHVATLLAAARAKNALVVYSGIPGSDATTTLPEVAPKGGEPSVVSTADKFYNTDLDATLKAKNIKTVVVCGNAGNGAALYTASAAALRGYNVILPVDCIPANSAYIEQYVVYQFTAFSTLVKATTLSRSDMVTF